MPTIADILNCPHEVAYKGKTYQLRQPDQLEQGKFSRWLEGRAWAAFERRAGQLDEAEAARLERNTAQDIASGVYEFGSEASAVALQTPAGGAKLVHILLARDHPDITEAEARELFEHRLKEILAAVAAGATQDPKAVAAVLALVGLPPDFLKPRSTSSRKSQTRRSTKRKRKSGR
jgi:hypothetical protein